MPEMTEKVMDTIAMILSRGNSAEVKIEHGNVVVIEIKRKKVDMR